MINYRMKQEAAEKEWNILRIREKKLDEEEKIITDLRKKEPAFLL